MTNLADCHIKTIPNGRTAEMVDYHDYSRVHFDGNIYIYDTQGMSLATFKIAVAAAFQVDDEDDLDVIDWGGTNIYRADIA